MRHATETGSTTRARRSLGLLLVAAGVVLGARPLAVWIHATQYQRATLHRFAEAEAAPSVLAGETDGARAPQRGESLGILEIPRLGLSAAVVHGDDAAILDVAIGHLPDTPAPGATMGNSALAAHRDTFFRPLRAIAAGDDVIFRSSGQRVAKYRVADTLIVELDDVWVLAPTDRASLTLITCYPFSYVGTAPQRFVVRAVRVDPP